MRIKKIVLAVVAIFISFRAYGGLPYNPDFPTAEWPYAKAPNGCGSAGLDEPQGRDVRDTWGPVSFKGGCNNHDRCFYTLGTAWQNCNDKFRTDLKEACYHDLRTYVPPVTLGGVEVTPSFWLPPEPATLASCSAIVDVYYGAVQAAAVDVFPAAQYKQAHFETWVRSLATPVVSFGPRWLDAASDGRTVTIIAAQTHGTRWRIEKADGGLITLRSANRFFETEQNPRWLDGASDGSSVTVVGGQSHGTLWKVEDAGNGLVRLRSWNQNFRLPENARWLDGSSDGSRVSLVNGMSQGTRWRIEPEGKDIYLRSYNVNFAPL